HGQGVWEGGGIGRADAATGAARGPWRFAGGRVRRCGTGPDRGGRLPAARPARGGPHPSRGMTRRSTAFIALLLAACSAKTASPTTTTTSTSQRTTAAAPAGEKITVFSGRPRELMQPLFDAFTKETRVQVDAVFGDTFELADRLAKEGSSTTADVFLSEDGGALGRLGKADLLAQIPQDTLDEVEARFRSSGGLWVGISARARTIAFNTTALTDTQVP